MEKRERKDDERLSQRAFVAVYDGTVKWKFSFIMFSWYSFKLNPLDGGKKVRFVHTEIGPCTLTKLERAFVKNWENIEGALGYERGSKVRDDILREAVKQPKTRPYFFAKFN